MSKTPTEKQYKDIVWAPLPGSQQMFMTCPIRECLLQGTRGGGKTDTLIMSYCQHVGKGYGQFWRGIIFREQHKNLKDIIAKSKRWIPKIWPTAKFNESKCCWTWPTGEALFFAHARKLSDYDNYHGHEYPFVGWEELTNWATPELYLKMFSVCRSSGPKEMPRIIRGTTNPSGRGHGWVKRRFIEPAPCGTIITDPNSGNERIAIFSHWSENKFLLDNDPNYIKNLLDNPEHLVKAWVYGSWDIVAGGMFDDVWKSEYNVVPPFTIPGTWRIDRGFDPGSGHPFSVLWFAESDGCDIKWENGDWMPTRKGDIFVIAEWYGCDPKDESVGLKMTMRDIAKGILKRENAWNFPKVYPGPADTELWKVDGHMSTRAKQMEEEGVTFIKATKGPDSRIAGWDRMRTMIKSAWSEDEKLPGLFVFNTCRYFIAHVPVLPRDEINLEDVDTDALDHDADCCFVAGTMIITDRGQVPIESLRDDDKVLTRSGFCGMNWHGKTRIGNTYEATLSNGTILRGIGSHEIMTNEGWKRLDCLKFGDSLESSGKKNFISVVALGKTGVKEQTYNLGVDGPEEYYANGILVHNCRYRLTTKRPVAKSGTAKGTY